MKLITLKLILIFSYLNTIHSQDSLKINSLVKHPSFSSQELDSVLKTIAKEYNSSNYEKVIEKVPGLIENAIEVKSRKVEKRLSSILGNSFIHLEDYDNAYKFFYKTLLKAKSDNDSLEISRAYSNLGNTFFIQEPDKAIIFFEKGLNYIINDEEYDIGSFVVHNNLAQLYVNIKKPEKAQYYLDKSRLLLSSSSIKERKVEFESAGNYIQAAIYLQRREYEKAIFNCKKVLKTGKDTVHEGYILETYKVLIEAYTATKEHKKLNDIYAIYNGLIEKRNEQQRIRQQQIANSKFNLNQYKQELRETQLANEISEHKASKNKLLLNFSVILGVILLLLLGLLLYGRYKRKELVIDLKAKNKQYLESQERSEELAKSNTRFLSTISHELRTPLYGIIGLTSSLLNKNNVDSSDYDEIKSLKFSADYLLALVNDVLNMNKLESEEGKKLQYDHFILEKLINDIVQSFEFNNHKNNNTVSIDIDKSIPVVLKGDVMKLSQVLMNLMGNASKFTEDGRIYIKITQEQKTQKECLIHFSIRDTGVGIPLDEQDNIFNEFAQAKKNFNIKGTGLGLTIVNKILHVFGTKLSLESVINEGSTFSFSINLEESNLENIKESQTRPNVENLKNKKILIVDDNKINQLVTQKVLEQYNMCYDKANNGIEAVKKAEEQNFDAILMDINMPVMNGLDASKKIRTFDNLIPIIALTATNYRKENKQLLDHGINEVIVKPYDVDKLINLLTKYTN